MLTSEPFRNDKSVVFKNVILTAAIFVLMCIWTIGEYPIISVLLIIVPVALSSVLFYYYWKKTTITISDEDIIVERDTVFKMKKTIPFIKIASVNADRDIIDRIFGTTKLKININSAKNAAVPEAVLTLSIPFAENVRSELSRMIFNQSYVTEEYKAAESVVKFNKNDFVLHGLFSLSSYQTLFALLMLIYSVVMIYLDRSGGVLFAILMLALVQVVPAIALIIRYYNFKVFRTGDTIHIQHGAIQNYHTSFEIQRVNAIRIRRTFFARVLGKAYIEAEVVGLGGGDGEMRPMISILSKESNIDIIMESILPEFIYEKNPEKQPKEAKWPLAVNMAMTFVIIIPLMVAASFLVSEVLNGNIMDVDITGTLATLMEWTIPILMIAVILITVASAVMSLRLRELDLGEDMFTIRNGILDREEYVINYDKVQIVQIRSGLPAKKFGLAKCRVSVLSSTGGTKVSTGYFSETDLSTIADVMLERVRGKLS